MKWLFFVFLLANLLVFALTSLGGGKPVVDPRGREINASQIQIVTGQLATRKNPEPASPPAATEPASQPASAPQDVAVPASPVSATKPAEKLVCLRWSGFTLAQANTARSRIRALGLSTTESGGAENAKVWVYIPPLENQTVARRKALEIADMGVEDYFVVNDGGRWQNAISLGIFSTREAGERRLAELRGKGVRSAVVRDKNDTLKPVTFLLRNVSAENRQKLESTSRQFRGVELRETACR